ncbi:hypothetical protein GJ496_005667 [Pomphorhynchus laevis]|nr:hypothetical protein GJ496_005667 [Pomphorhynchus laevis]
MPGGKGLGKRFSALRKRLELRRKGANDRALRRLARRAGCKRISKQMFDKQRVFLKEFLRRVLLRSVLIVENRHQRTVLKEDIEHALNDEGFKFYS